jgi:pimeloyl-ACP methyl ester carboxylesterase
MQEQVLHRVEREVSIPAGRVMLAGALSVPAHARSIVLFAHGSGSSRNSPRNTFVANLLQEAGLGTLLFDLLTSAEEQIDLYTREHRFDIPLLAERIVYATNWLETQSDLRDLPVGYFGASTGSAAALVAAAKLGDRVGAIVSRGGRPDLAGPVLRHVTAPTLLIVGGDDDVVIDLNQVAYEELRSVKDLKIVPGASHLFEEPGTLEVVATLTADWLNRYLVRHAD